MTSDPDVWLTEVQDFLVSQGVGTMGTSGNLTILDMPQAPQACMTLYEYAGEPDEWTADGVKVAHPGLHIEVRDTDPINARKWLERAKNALEQVKNSWLGGTLYGVIRPAQGVTPLGKDEAGLYLMSQNYKVSRNE